MPPSPVDARLRAPAPPSPAVMRASAALPPLQHADAAASSAPGGRRVVREIGHALLVAAGWVGFVWMWVVVARQRWAVEGLLWVIGASLLVVPLLTAAWVLHNRAIHRRKGERRAVAAVAIDYAHDWHGRAVQADWAALKRSRSVVVTASAAVKTYAGRHDLPSAEPRAPAANARGAER